MIYQQKFTLAQLAEVVGKNPATLRTHINRGYVVAVGPRNANGDKPTGKHARFSFFTLMQFAMAYELNELGVQLELAFKGASEYAHTGGGGDVFGLPERNPSTPFHFEFGETIFAMTPDRSWEELWKAGAEYDTYGKFRRHLNSDHFITLNASELFNRICARLGLHPYEVLDEVYSKKAIKAD